VVDQKSFLQTLISKIAYICEIANDRKIFRFSAAADLEKVTGIRPPARDVFKIFLDKNAIIVSNKTISGGDDGDDLLRLPMVVSFCRQADRSASGSVDLSTTSTTRYELAARLVTGSRVFKCKVSSFK